LVAFCFRFCFRYLISGIGVGGVVDIH
jgi:hypothetical protein